MCRLQKELMVLMMSTEKGVSAFPDGENLFKWIGTITGPRDTVIYFYILTKVLINMANKNMYNILIIIGLCWSYVQINFGISS